MPDFDLVIKIYLRQLLQRQLYDSALENILELYNAPQLPEEHKKFLEYILSRTDKTLIEEDKIVFYRDFDFFINILENNKNIINLKKHGLEVKNSNKDGSKVEWSFKNKDHDFKIEFFKYDSHKINYSSSEKKMQFSIIDNKIYLSKINFYDSIGNGIFDEHLNNKKIANKIISNIKKFNKENNKIFKLNNYCLLLDGEERNNMLSLITKDNYYDILMFLEKNKNNIEKVYKEFMIFKNFGDDITNLSKDAMDEIFIITDINPKEYFKNNLIEKNAYIIGEKIRSTLKI